MSIDIYARHEDELVYFVVAVRLADDDDENGIWWDTQRVCADAIASARGWSVFDADDGEGTLHVGPRGAEALGKVVDQTEEI